MCLTLKKHWGQSEQNRQKFLLQVIYIPKVENGNIEYKKNKHAKY